MRCYSLFSGIGGFDLALKNQGHTIVGACEIDRYARQIYQKNFGRWPSEYDATEIIPEQLPDFELLCAGFPCQTFSIAGKRLGFEESRGTLFFEIARIARQKRPRLLLLENVEGLLNHDGGKTFANILATLDELRYDAEWQVCNSKYFLPQNRPRIFIIGHLRGKPTRKIFPIVSEENTIPSKKSIQKCRRNDIRNIWTVSMSEESRSSILSDYKEGRDMTPMEYERLQGFPDNWTSGIPERMRYEVCGNAVSVPIIEFLVRRLAFA